MATTHPAPWVPEVETFGDRLVLLRRKAGGITQEQAAKRAGIAVPTWGTWELGSMPRSMATVVTQIAEAFGVDRDWLMWGAREQGSAPTPRYGDAAQLRVAV